ncbi:MAG: FAD-dependent oxidoreductase [Propionivibrio sp.]|nr:FAD-dependent oxidoreductase [Propionivibrio sp.]
MNFNHHFAVIGAGIAGLSCATALQQAGLKVSLFDKSRGPAGRMSTRHGDGWQCDHGAQYFTARDPDFRAEVSRWVEAGVAGLWKPRLKVFDGLSSQDRDSTLERFVGVPCMTAPACWLADSLAFSAQTTIKQLQRHQEGWQLLSLEHGVLPECFDAILLALPAPQAATLLQQTSSALVQLGALAGSAVMRGSWALMLRYATPLELPFDAAFVNQGPLRWIARDSSKPGRNGTETWLLHASAEWSEAHLAEDADNIAALLLHAFEQLGGTSPQAWTAHRWLYADSDPALEMACAWQAEHGLGLCGDWLNGGKVEGAWLSGRALAQQAVNSLGTGGQGHEMPSRPAGLPLR